jgi:hypothetical protein
MNSSIKAIVYVKVYATFNTFVGLEPPWDVTQGKWLSAFTIYIDES